MQRRTSLTLALTALGASLAPIAQAPATAAETGTVARATQRIALLTADFDGMSSGRVTSGHFRSAMGGGSTSDTAFDDSSIVARGSGKAYRLTLDRGTYKGSTGNNGVNVFVPLAKQVDNACLAYDVKFDGNFAWDMGGKLPGLGGVRAGVTPGTPTGGGNPGDKGWSGRMMWLSPQSYSWAGPTDQMVQYMYSPHQTEYYGDNVRWNKSFSAGKWHHVRMCYKMNTVGKADGVLKTKLDGQRVLDIRNYVYRLRNDVHISHLYWVVFRGGATHRWAAHRTSFIDFDNLRVSSRA